MAKPEGQIHTRDMRFSLRLPACAVAMRASWTRKLGNVFYKSVFYCNGRTALALKLFKYVIEM
jgi:hypothetical protein